MVNSVYLIGTRITRIESRRVTTGVVFKRGENLWYLIDDLSTIKIFFENWNEEEVDDGIKK